MRRRRDSNFGIVFLAISTIVVWASLIYAKFFWKVNTEAGLPGSCPNLFWIIPDVACQWNNLMWIFAGIAFLLSLLIAYGFTGRFTTNSPVRWGVAVALAILVGLLILNYFIWGVLLFILYIVLLIAFPPLGIATATASTMLKR